MFLQMERWVEREHSFLGRQLFFSFWSKNMRWMLHLFYWLRCQQGCISICGVIAACLWKEDRNGAKLLSWIKRGDMSWLQRCGSFADLRLHSPILLLMQNADLFLIRSFLLYLQTLPIACVNVLLVQMQTFSLSFRDDPKALTAS